MLELADIFQDSMVLQHGKSIGIWGISDPMADISVEIQGQYVETKADEKGQWICFLSPLDIEYKGTLIIQSDKECKIIQDIAVGEVWIAAGQSNMEFPLKYEKHRTEEKGEFFDNIRFFDVPKIAFDGQLENFDYSQVNRWRKMDSNNLDYVTAVGYYFAKTLTTELNIPIGIVGCNWSGTLAEAWMKEESVIKFSPDWYSSHSTYFQGKNIDEYWEKQRVSIWNDKGSPINEVNDIVLPCTLSEEEFEKLFLLDVENSEEVWDEWRPEAFPGALFEHMVKRIGNYGVRGILWYQGESNDIDLSRDRYGEILEALINDWRNLLGNDLPFLVVQLPGMENWVGLRNLGYEILRQKQQDVADRMKGVWLCSISDAGERWDIHPKNKKIVGDRLGLLALGHVYNKPILCDAPRCISVIKEENRLICKFSNVGEGLVLKEKETLPLKVFTDGKQIEFNVYVKEDCMIIETDMRIICPLQINFAQEKWFCVNLYSSVGIPVLPFTYEIK